MMSTFGVLGYTCILARPPPLHKKKLHKGRDIPAPV
jgi:hypothetical protein